MLSAEGQRLSVLSLFEAGIEALSVGFRLLRLGFRLLRLGFRLLRLGEITLHFHHAPLI